MRHDKRSVAKILAVAFLAVALIGCEDSDPTAPTDGVINLSVTPTVITIDPNLGETEGSTTVIAAVFNAEGVPLANVAVLFTTEAGTLASGRPLQRIWLSAPSCPWRRNVSRPPFAGLK